MARRFRLTIVVRKASCLRGAEGTMKRKDGA